MQKKIHSSYENFYDNNVDFYVNNYFLQIDKDLSKNYIFKIFSMLKEIYYYNYLQQNINNNKEYNDNTQLLIMQLNSDLEAIIEDFENSLYEVENPQFDIPQKVYNFRIDMINNFKNYLQNFITINYI